MLTVTDINKCVAKAYMISPYRLTELRSERCVTEARNMAMYKCRMLLKLSYPKIARLYGLKNHNSAMADVKTAAGLMETDSKTCEISKTIDGLLYECQFNKKEKERYDLHYRLRQKGFEVDCKNRTISVQPDEITVLSKKQVKRLLNKQYGIQYKLPL